MHDEYLIRCLLYFNKAALNSSDTAPTTMMPNNTTAQGALDLKRLHSPHSRSSDRWKPLCRHISRQHLPGQGRLGLRTWLRSISKLCSGLFLGCYRMTLQPTRLPKSSMDVQRGTPIKTITTRFGALFTIIFVRVTLLSRLSSCTVGIWLSVFLKSTKKYCRNPSSYR